MRQERGSIHRTVFSLGHLSVPWIFTFWKKAFSCPAWRKLTAWSCGVWGFFLISHGSQRVPAALEGTQLQGIHEVAPRWPPGQLPRSVLSPPGQPCWVRQPGQGTGKASDAIAGCTVRGPPGKASVRQGLRKEDSIPQKSSLGAFIPPTWGAAWAGHQAQPCHRPGAWQGSWGAARALQRPSWCHCPSTERDLWWCCKNTDCDLQKREGASDFREDWATQKN